MTNGHENEVSNTGENDLIHFKGPTTTQTHMYLVNLLLSVHDYNFPFASRLCKCQDFEPFKDRFYHNYGFMNFLKTEYKRTNGTQLKISCIVERFIFSEQDNYKLQITTQRNSPNSSKG